MSEVHRRLRHRLAVLATAVLLAACNHKSAPELLVSAKQYLASNNPKSAIVQLKNALQIDPNLAEARFLLGKASLDIGDAATAVAELQRANALHYPEVQVIPPLARAMVLDRQAQKLIEQYAQTDLPEPAALADLKTSLATAQVLQSDVPKARIALDAALQAVPGYPAASNLQARLLAGEGQFDAALALVERTLAATPGDAEAWRLKGEFLQFGKDDAAGAQAAYRQALTLQPNNAEIHADLIALLLMQRDLPAAGTEIEALRKLAPGQPQLLYFDAQMAFLKKDDKRAHELAEQLLRLRPDDVKALQLAGASALNLRLLPEAERSLDRAVKLRPDLPAGRHLLAQTYLRMGQPAKALLALEPLLTRAGGDAAAAGLAAEAQLLSGNPAEAQAYFAKAAALDPRDVRSRVAVAMGRLGKGETAAALADLDSIAATDKGTAAEMALLAARLRTKDYAQALKVIDKIEAKQPDKPLPALLRGRVQLLRKDMPAARASFERALAIDPLYVPAASGLALLDLADKHPDAAKKRFETVLKADPKNPDALLAIAGIRASAGAPAAEVAGLLADAIRLNPEDARPRVMLVDHHLAQRDAKAALATAQEAAAALPGNPQALDALGRAQVANGDNQQAIASFEKIAAIDPQSPDPLLQLTSLYLAAKDGDAAMRSVRRALALNPRLLPAQRLLMDLEVHEKRPDEAIAVARTIQKQRPDEAVGFMAEGAVKLASGDLPGAADAYRAVLKKFPSVDPAVKLHSVLVAQKKDGEADKLASSWMASHPKDAAFLFYLGEASLAKRDFAAAETQFQRVIQVAPDNALALNNLAWVMTELHKPGAVAYAQKASTLLPGAAALVDTLAAAYASENQVDKAVDTQKRAVAMAPGNAVLRLNLAKLYIRSGDKPKARSELETLANSADQSDARGEARTLLTQL